MKTNGSHKSKKYNWDSLNITQNNGLLFWTAVTVEPQKPSRNWSFASLKSSAVKNFMALQLFILLWMAKIKISNAPTLQTQMIPLESEFRQKQHKYSYKIIHLQNAHHHSRSNQQSSGPNMQFSYCTSPGLVSIHLLIYNLQETCQSKPVSKAKAHYVHLQADISHPSLFSMYSANIYIIGNHIFFSTCCFSSMLMSYTRLCKWKTYDGLGE